MSDNKLQLLKTRAVLNRYIREFFHARGVIEVETPMLSQAGNTDPNIESFQTQFSGSHAQGEAMRWLRTSPEFPLKRLLSEGMGDCYELGRVFRNGEAGRNHNPEFTLLEWYRLGWDHHRLADEVVELVAGLLKAVGRTVHTRKQTYAELFAPLGFDPHRASLDDLRAHVRTHAHVMRVDELDRDDCLNVLLTHVIEPNFPADQLLMVHDFPATQCALARLRVEHDLSVAERFEVYLGRVELANGYHELTDADVQLKRFEQDNLKRAQRGAVQPPIDHRLIEAMRSGLPACAGVAMGVDRLLLSLSGAESLAATLAFPFGEA